MKGVHASRYCCCSSVALDEASLGAGRPGAAVAGEAGVRPSRRTSLETSLFSLAWPLRRLIGAGMSTSTGQVIIDVQRHVKQASLGWMAATLDGIR